MMRLANFDGSYLDLSAHPQRIISLVPSITETLLQFEIPVLGRTSFCIEPADRVKSIEALGGTKTPRIKRIIALQPDLVIANKEENIKEHIEALKAAGIPVWINNPSCVDHVVPLLREISQLTPNASPAMTLIASCEKSLSKLRENTKTFSGKSPKACMFIWKNPWMGVGGDTYAGDLLTQAGFENLHYSKERYPAVDLDQLADQGVAFVFLPSEPYAFGLSEAEELKTFFDRRGLQPVIKLVSGEDMTWPGLRLPNALHTLMNV